MKKYKITLNERQLVIVEHALEEYFRLRMGQDFDFSDDLAEMGQDLSTDNPECKRIFAEYIVRRDAIGEIMKAVFRIAFGTYGVPEEKNKRHADCRGHLGCDPSCNRQEQMGQSASSRR